MSIVESGVELTHPCFEINGGKFEIWRLMDIHDIEEICKYLAVSKLAYSL